MGKMGKWGGRQKLLVGGGDRIARFGLSRDRTFPTHFPKFPRPPRTTFSPHDHHFADSKERGLYMGNAES